jgi:hypothetical protein
MMAGSQFRGDPAQRTGQHGPGGDSAQRSCRDAGHDAWLYGVAIGRAGDRDVIVSGGGDDTVRAWDAVTGEPLGDPLAGTTRLILEPHHHMHISHESG